jgi:peptidyl-tRNA hydrolase
MLYGFKELMVLPVEEGEDELIKYRRMRHRKTDTTSESAEWVCGNCNCDPCTCEEINEIQTGWYHKTQKHHTIKHPDGSHYGVYDHSVYGKDGYEIRKIRDKDGKALKAKDSRKQSGNRYAAGGSGGPTKAAHAWVKKHGGTITNHKVKEEVDEALNIQQRLARSRQAKKYQARLKMGRKKAAMKVADKTRLMKRARKAARTAVTKKLYKNIDKKDLTAAKKQEIEKRLDKMGPRIDRLAKKMLPKIRQKEMQKRRG